MWSDNFIHKLACGCAFATALHVELASAQICSVVEHQRHVHEFKGPQLQLFGLVLAASTDWAIIGNTEYVPTFFVAGAAHFLRKTEGGWTSGQLITSAEPVPGDQFGWAVAIDGRWAVVGNPRHDSPDLFDNGAVQVYFFDGEQWHNHSTLVGDGIGPSGGSAEWFGESVALQGPTLLVGAPRESSIGTARGAVYAFEFDGANWVRKQKFFAIDSQEHSNFGRSLVLDGDVVMISRASRLVPSSTAPHVYVYRRGDNQWSFEQALTPGSASFAIGGNRAAIANGVGSVFAFEYNGSAWQMVQRIISPGYSAQQHFGTSMVLEGERLLIGSPLHDVTYQYPTYETTMSQVGYVFHYRLNGQQWIEHQRMQPAFYDNSVAYPNPNNYQMGWGIDVSRNELIANARPGSGWPVTLWFDLESAYCDGNGMPDSCDPDCNLNLVNDACEIAAGTAGDCNANSVPDECEESPEYLFDDGTSFVVYGFVNNAADLIWIKQFNVAPGGEYVTHISLPWSNLVPEGTPGTVMLYSDPNNDGDPKDAVLLASRPIVAHEQFGINLSAFTIESIDRTFVGHVGDSFFVGAMMHTPMGAFVAAVDGEPGLGRSWRWTAPLGQANIEDLAANTMPPNKFAGNWMLRAYSLDCNGNDIWDQCDIASGTSFDLNANGIPDECDAPCPADIVADGSVDVGDLLAVINHWGASGPGQPADVNGDEIVDVADLLAVINAWGVCP